MGKHEAPGKSDEWYTPAYVFEAMGARFDTDVATSPRAVAAGRWCATGVTKGALDFDWRDFGFVWMNPPFGKRNAIVPWLETFVRHADGVALTPDRTSAPWWRDYAPRMDLVLFVSPKIRFIPGPGAKASSPAQGTCLMALGERGELALRRAARAGLGVLFIPAGA